MPISEKIDDLILADHDPLIHGQDHAFALVFRFPVRQQCVNAKCLHAVPAQCKDILGFKKHSDRMGFIRIAEFIDRVKTLRNIPGKP